ncbi:MAG: pyridoxamine 5'-phosphate oxidase family protein [Thiogranum sp.]|nr:pyridoxamine 5'-phosphate oxidase family protein [Thiogranum sp.]
MDRENNAISRVRADMRRFRASVDNLLLATVSPDGVPEASAAPAIAGDSGEFYIYISRLARHTANLEAHPQAGVLLIEPVDAAANAFARQRLSYQCKATLVPRDTVTFNLTMQRFTERFGDIVATLRNLPDFQLVRLTPVSGTYVRGFGQAWRLTGPGLHEIEHIGSPAKPQPT